MPGDVPRYYWDACVPLAYIQDEQDRARLIEAMMKEAENSQYELYTSVLSITEVAFSKEEKQSEQLETETVELIDALWQPSSPLVVVEFFPQVAVGARNLLREAVSRGWRLKPPDAMHLATAHHLEVEQFHTYDDGLKRWEELLGFAVREPEPIQTPLI